MTAQRPVRPPVIGLTGAVAAGKSTVAALLREGGCDVVDVDALGHQALAATTVRDAVTRVFGRDVLDPAGETLDRAALAACVFDDPEALARLEALVHPWVRRRIDERLDRVPVDARAVIVDAALLFEGGLESLCDVTVCVDTPRELRVRRACDARGWSEEEVAHREARQLPPDEKRARADRVLTNDEDRERLRERVARLLEELAPAGLPPQRRNEG